MMPLSHKTNSPISLRALEPSDLDFLYAIENDTRYWYLGSVCSPYSKAVLLQYLDSAHLDIYSTKQLRLIIEVEDNAIGAIDLYDFDPKNRKTGIGIFVLERYRKNNYAFDALTTLSHYCQNTLNLHQIYATIPAGNKASIKLFQKMRFEECGIKKDWLFHNGAYEDAIEMQLLF